MSIIYYYNHFMDFNHVYYFFQPLCLHLLDIPQMMGVLEGVVMELNDCAFPLLRGELFAIFNRIQKFSDCVLN